MQRRWSLLVLIIVIVTSMTTGFSFGGKVQENYEVERAVHDFFNVSKQLQRSGYVESIYTLEKTEKVDDNKYEAFVTRTVGGLEYPTIPYDVVFQDGRWKLDNSSIFIYPKKDYLNELKAHGLQLSQNSYFYQTVVSENDNFIVRKDSGSQNFLARGVLYYDFGQKSTDIYSSGSLKVNSYPEDNGKPDDSYNYVAADFFSEDPIDSVWVSTKFLDAFDADVAIYYCNGYHSVKVYNVNYGSKGRYYVSY
ncbi:hypothetical protein DUZ99_08550 [Xylanibacillus composti]|uniref:Uncharacterized protein n=1 Tax=Xylanibacillus composti TaxID=1572762 RepID=A0A8J4M147_9BACL|nr:hypothetical protein [Xylanibacillus composti]MDT9725044.1 hypothetical protein [Xylanibacillus composti]GIQ67477.1 hypothetical protein XYCOK13_03010 [Xylanibacillus composti]